jgi:hypothetical protein
MKLFKKIVAVILAIVVVVLITAIFTKKDYALVRQTTINKPNTEVFDYVKMLKNSDHFNKWTMADPNMKKTFTGKDGTLGFVYAWDSEQAGKGEQEITGIAPSDSAKEGRIDYEIRFIKPFEGKADTYIATVPLSPNQTKVEWAFSSKMAYPMNIMLLFMDMEDFLGKDLDVSLLNLKNQLEKN